MAQVDRIQEPPLQVARLLVSSSPSSARRPFTRVPSDGGINGDGPSTASSGPCFAPPSPLPSASPQRGRGSRTTSSAEQDSTSNALSQPVLDKADRDRDALYGAVA